MDEAKKQQRKVLVLLVLLTSELNVTSSYSLSERSGEALHFVLLLRIGVGIVRAVNKAFTSF